MSQWMIDFLKRIHYQSDEAITFENLPEVMSQFAKHIPFENIDIMKQQDHQINKDFLYQKIICERRGGLCYELNPLFYSVLNDLGFRVQMVKATIDSNKKTLKNTHISTILYQADGKYIVDVGFGANQALRPVPFTGEFVHAISGDYRIKKLAEEGWFVYEKFQDAALVIRYAFKLDPIAEHDINYAKELVTVHPDSPFNKSLLLTKTTDKGHRTLTDTSYTVMEDGEKYKENIDSKVVKKLSNREFGIKI